MNDALGINQTNSKSVISLTLGILSILVPLIGLLLGIIGRLAKKELSEKGGSGSRLALAGLV